MGKVVHVVLWKLVKPAGLTGPALEEALVKAKTAIAQLKTVPGPESLHLGPPLILGRNKDYDYGLYSVFTDREALNKYAVSEAHVKAVANAKPHLADALAYDFELDE